MKVKEFSEYLLKLENTSSRLEITDILSDLIKKADKDEIDKVIYLSLGILAPSYEGVVFNIAEKMMVKIVASAFDESEAEVRASYKRMGDIGKTAEELSSKESSSMSVDELYKKLREIALDEGEGSTDRKIVQTAKLLNDLDKLSVRFVSRMPVGNLRLGFSDKTVIDALSVAVAGDKSAKKEIEKAYEVMPDVGKLSLEVKKHGVKNLSKSLKPIVGVPVMPMLAQRLKSTDEMIAKMDEVAVEPKFDGLRVLIHYKNGQLTKAFTRNLNDISEMFPELDQLGKHIKAEQAILDSEAVGLDPKTKKMVDFQKTMQRRRKHQIETSSRDIPLRFQIFDCILKDDKSLMNEPYTKRREVLEKLFDKNSTFVLDEKIITTDPDVIRKKHQELLDKGLEGVIVKKADSTYVPGRTGWRWVKMKEVEEAHGKLADTVDAVIMGYTRGRGKRAEFGIGQFLAGVIDPERSRRIKTITKVGTGLTDEQFRELNKRLKKLVVKNMPKEYEVHSDLKPDYWVKPDVVVELAADEITKSPKHTAGLAMRFPRLIRFRDDKSVKQATTLKEFKHLHDLQNK